MNLLIRKVFQKIHFAILKLKIRNPSASPRLRDVLSTSWQPDPALEARYTQYIRDVSRADMAASFECIRFLTKLCTGFRCKKILDFGSGFSSYTFRYYAESGPGINVCSVDDDEQWIQKTAQFLRNQNVDASNLIMLDSFVTGSMDNFDLIFMDLNFVDVRKNFINLIAERCKPGGIIVFDDVHKPDFLYQILSLTNDHDLSFFNVKPLTLDRFGRFCLLAIRNS